MQYSNYFHTKFFWNLALASMITATLFVLDVLTNDQREKFNILLAEDHSCTTSNNQPVVFTIHDYAGYVSAILYAQNGIYELNTTKWKTDYPSKFWQSSLTAIQSNIVISEATITSGAIIDLNRAIGDWINACSTNKNTS